MVNIYFLNGKRFFQKANFLYHLEEEIKNYSKFSINVPTTGDSVEEEIAELFSRYKVKTYSQGGQSVDEIREAFRNSRIVGYALGGSAGGVAGHVAVNSLEDVVTNSTSQGLQKILLVVAEEGGTMINPILGVGIKLLVGAFGAVVGTKVSESITRKYLLRTTHTNNPAESCFSYDLVFEPIPNQ